MSALKMCSTFPALLAQLDTGVWVCACVGWRMRVKKLAYMCDTRRARACGRVIMCERVCACARVVSSQVRIWKASLLTTTFDDVCAQHRLCPEMVSDSRAYGHNEAETDEK